LIDILKDLIKRHNYIIINKYVFRM